MEVASVLKEDWVMALYAPAAFELGELETNFGHNAPLCVSRAKKRQIDKNRPVSISTIFESI
jgi:hypothetical protein